MHKEQGIISKKRITMQQSSKSPTYYLAKLSERHKNVALLLVQGVSNKEISEKLGLSEVIISKYKNSPLFQSYLRTLRERLNDDILTNERLVQSLVPKVLDLSHKLVDKAMEDDMKDSDAISLVKHWSRPFVELPSQGGTLLSDDEIEEIRNHSREPYFGKKEGKIKDVDYIPVEYEDLREEVMNESSDISSPKGIGEADQSDKDNYLVNCFA